VRAGAFSLIFVPETKGVSLETLMGGEEASRQAGRWAEGRNGGEEEAGVTLC
jgi:hypothetical protein